MTVPSMYYAGRVNTVVYANAGNAFYILKMVLDDQKSPMPVTVKGNVPGLQVEIGTWFGFEARWVNNEQYGRQLTITAAPVLRGDWDADTACKMLTANGVGSGLLQSIRDHFGDDHLIEALGSSDRLTEVTGITPFSADLIVSRWEAVQAHFKGMEYLSSLGLPAGVIREVWSHFGDEAQKVLATNPWALVEVEGITFQQADEVARKSGLEDATLRMRGAVLYACKSNRTFGHMFLRTGGVLHLVQSYITDATQAQVLEALGGLHKSKFLVLDRKTRPGMVAVYEPWSFEAEDESASLLLQRQQQAMFVADSEPTERYLSRLASVGPQTKAVVASAIEDRLAQVARAAIEEWGAFAHLTLSEPQKDGIFHALTAPVSVLSGLPGTGKTTSLRAAVRILQDADVPFLLAAPTGIAAKNLSARTGAPASTIHRAFSAQGKSERRASGYTGIEGTSQVAMTVPGEDAWGYGPNNPHPADVIIVDEASMMDQHLLYRLLLCTKPDARLVFVGDHAQLPSVGPGNVLRDLINVGIFPTVKLTQIFRQDDTSGIIYAAHTIHAGDVPETNKDFALKSLRSEDDVLDHVLKLGVGLYEKRRNFQILSPKHGGTVGVTNLNARLRELLNPASPGQTEIRLGNDIIREGDRIMIIQNDYKLGVFNGDVGKVNRVDRGKKTVEVKIFGAMDAIIQIDFKEVPRLLRLAYACTVHKAQGLEYDIIVMPLVTGFFHQLQRNLLYTAITRAKKKVVLVGHHEALVSAVYNAKEDERATLFLDRLLKSPSA